MNSDKQQPQTSYGDLFDSDDEISVSYEEITPKKPDRQEPPVDMWSDEEPTSESPKKPPQNLERDLTQKEPSQNEPIEDIAEPEPTIEPEPELVTNHETLSEIEPDPEPIAKQKTEPEPATPDLSNLELDNSAIASEDTEAGNWDDADDTDYADEPDADLDKDLQQLLDNVTAEPDEDKAEPVIAEEPSDEDPEESPDDSDSERDTPELIADRWLDETESETNKVLDRKTQLTSEIENLERQKESLVVEIANLRQQREEAIAEATETINLSLAQMIQEGTRELKDQKNRLLMDIEKLERRKQRIDEEMKKSFVGSSQDVAMRIQGFKKYLVGSLQDLSTAAERLELPSAEPPRRQQREPRPLREEPRSQPDSTTRGTRTYRDEPSRVSRNDRGRDDRRPSRPSRSDSQPSQFGEQTFDSQTRRIRQLLEQYRTAPDYYGAPWQLRRTFEPVHAERVQEWFFGQGGRGTIKGMGSRLQNILVASAVISVLHQLYRDRCRVLVLGDTPEKLGEWRRGLQDCLGISRNDFGSNRGIVLFESADVLVQRAERLIDDKLMPLVIIDEAEGSVNLGLLKFPLWLAFAESQQRATGYPY